MLHRPQKTPCPLCSSCLCVKKNVRYRPHIQLFSKNEKKVEKRAFGFGGVTY